MAPQAATGCLSASIGAVAASILAMVEVRGTSVMRAAMSFCWASSALMRASASVIAICNAHADSATDKDTRTQRKRHRSATDGAQAGPDCTSQGARTCMRGAPSQRGVMTSYLRKLTTIAALLAVLSSAAAAPSIAAGGYYQTKAPYAPQQDMATYERAPAGFEPVFTQMVARHGSRGLSSLKYDLAVYNMWQAAADESALTDLGKRLGPDVLALMKANFLLGYGVDGISKPGYGNETQVGIAEHQEMAKRVLSRLPSFWQQVGTGQRQIVVVTSGVDRAVDSGAYFVKALIAAQANLARLVTYPPAPAPYPAANPVAQPAGTDRFLLYFHKLAAATDLANPGDKLSATYQASLAYQAYQNDAEVLARAAAALADPAVKAAGRAVMERLFTPAFVNKIDAGAATFANTGKLTFTSADGKFSSTLTGDGKTTIKSAADAGQLLYELYSIAPAMMAEANVDFTPYMPAEQAMRFAFAADAADFYAKGPGFAEAGDVTYRMARLLVDDFFKEVDAIARGDLGHAAKFRFTHAEILIPFATAMGLPGAATPLPRSLAYSYDASPWRGELVSPMGANMQWDVFRNPAGTILVRMLYGEKEADFKPACDSAKLSPSSHYYDYTRLAACYGAGKP
jgi:hypothetical protein